MNSWSNYIKERKKNMHSGGRGRIVLIFSCAMCDQKLFLNCKCLSFRDRRQKYGFTGSVYCWKPLTSSWTMTSNKQLPVNSAMGESSGCMGHTSVKVRQNLESITDAKIITDWTVDVAILLLPKRKVPTVDDVTGGGGTAGMGARWGGGREVIVRPILSVQKWK